MTVRRQVLAGRKSFSADKQQQTVETMFKLVQIQGALWAEACAPGGNLNATRLYLVEENPPEVTAPGQTTTFPFLHGSGARFRDETFRI